ncbi:hypothetical protein VTJ49DRAFT_7452 [Mycothermus thermophilus]|uniref:Rhodopsin domain-containing protein n=1 Tax=Humicola insolens TaxID=85995 RepID=A0ABR3VIA4_HUMIN
MVVYVPLAGNPRGVTIIAVLWSMAVFSAIFVALRLYSKITRTRHVWWDDHFIVAAWILLLVSCSTTTANARLGFGLHTYEVPFENIVPFGIQSNVSGFTSILAVACSKTSFAITLLRLSDGWMKWFIIVLVILLNLTHYTSSIFFWVSCNPPAKTWNPLLEGECWPISVTVNYSLFVGGTLSAFSDFALALLPWRLLLRFNMYNREKIGVAICMSMGIFAGITCIVKMTTIPLLYDGDFSYNSLPLVLWGFMEPSLTIVAASIPVLRHLFRSFRRDHDSTLPPMSRSDDPTSSHAGAGARARARAAAAGATADAGNNSASDEKQQGENVVEKAARGNYQLQRQQLEAAVAAEKGTATAGTETTGTGTTLTATSSPRGQPSSPVMRHQADNDNRSESSTLTNKGGRGK